MRVEKHFIVESAVLRLLGISKGNHVRRIKQVKVRQSPFPLWEVTVEYPASIDNEEQKYAAVVV